MIRPRPSAPSFSQGDSSRMRRKHRGSSIRLAIEFSRRMKSSGAQCRRLLCIPGLAEADPGARARHDGQAHRLTSRRPASISGPQRARSTSKEERQQGPGSTSRPRGTTRRSAQHDVEAEPAVGQDADAAIASAQKRSTVTRSPATSTVLQTAITPRPAPTT